ncbi:MAG TPA: transglutaminase-like cysteine peptidase, partial [Caulobacteraceae bacterium]
MNNPYTSEFGNKVKLLLKLLAAAAVGMGVVGCASTGSLSGGYMQLGARAAPPAGYIDFCARKPQECGLRVAASLSAPPDEAQTRLEKTLYRKYLWAVAFARDGQTPRAAPAVMTAAAPPADSRSLSLAYQDDPSQGDGAETAAGSLMDEQQAEGSAQQPRLVLASMSSHPQPESMGGQPELQPALLQWAGKPSQDEALPQDQAPVASLQPAPDALGPQATAVSSPAAQADAQADDGVEVQEERSNAVVVPLTDETMGQLNLVNHLVNQLITFAPDNVVYGKDDYWAEPLEEQAGPKRGDCEDYVLEKRRALLVRGIPAAALSIAVVRTRRGEGHAVLLVVTDRGELVLDSLS